ncbi:MAG TPA: hypothetical protein VEH29_12060, partial [Acidimicrobiales bacterium]|nr:hypothetical protein [Acidimicrobiales bacterium]
ILGHGVGITGRVSLLEVVDRRMLKRPSLPSAPRGSCRTQPCLRKSALAYCFLRLELLGSLGVVGVDLLHLLFMALLRVVEQFADSLWRRWVHGRRRRWDWSCEVTRFEVRKTRGRFHHGEGEGLPLQGQRKQAAERPEVRRQLAVLSLGMMLLRRPLLRVPSTLAGGPFARGRSLRPVNPFGFDEHTPKLLLVPAGPGAAVGAIDRQNSLTRSRSKEPANLAALSAPKQPDVVLACFAAEAANTFSRLLRRPAWRTLNREIATPR